MAESVEEGGGCNECVKIMLERDVAIRNNKYFMERIRNQKEKYTLAMKSMSASIHNLRQTIRELEKICKTRQKVIQIIKEIQMDEAKQEFASFCLKHLCSKHYLRGLMDMKRFIDSIIERYEAVEGPIRGRRDSKGVINVN